ncbi:MAG: hypothetical protein M1834_000137 [Cirrosporium novae-zelandiae]|nr:MAG: hypothetical protein M1834_000137 [Cirrosporium novae-zelandiae]
MTLRHKKSSVFSNFMKRVAGTTKSEDKSLARPVPTVPTPENVTMMQAFEWYIPADHQHWRRLEAALPSLKSIGVDNIWIPPGCKASSPQGNGYDIYDLYDLGEFDQKGSRGTKWGTKEELMQLLERAEQIGIGIYWDAVLNHKAAADHTERCKVVKVDPDDRRKTISKPFEIEAWLGFDFPGRQNRYSSQKYHWHHFSGTDYDNKTGKSAIYKIVNKNWSTGVDTEKGNYDYLMFADVDYSNPEVVADVKNWGSWMGNELKIKGIRFDAVKHYSEDFLKEFIAHLDQDVGKGWFFVGEFWKDSLEHMQGYLKRMGHHFSLFDVPLVYNFSRISRTDKADLRRVFERTLVKHEPKSAVTFVMNHDTQPMQALEAPIADFFKPLGYALILLRAEGYPCVFYGDLYGIMNEKRPAPPSCAGRLPDLSLARKLYAYGKQHDYFDTPHCIGWVRRGTWDRPSGLACIMSNTGPGQKRMLVGASHRGEIWSDVLGNEKMEVRIDDKGYGKFTCQGHSVSVWVNRMADVTATYTGHTIDASRMRIVYRMEWLDLWYGKDSSLSISDLAPSPPPYREASFHEESDIREIYSIFLKYTPLPPELILPIFDLAELWLLLNAENDDMIRVSQATGDHPYVTSPPIQGQGKQPVKKVVFRITSHDQGWSTNDRRLHGTHEGSYTWFEAWVFPAPDREGKAPRKRRLCTNIHASLENQTRTLIWRADEEGENGEWVRSLRQGDQISIVPLARFPGWANFVVEAKIKIYTGVLV